MAQRRMFSPEIVCSDAFLDMPSSARDLYYQLGMVADDDGFVNPRKIMRMLGSSEDDLKLLIAKRFVIPFPSGVLVIKHWKINNLVRKDWYRPSLYQEEKSTLYLKENGSYTEDSTQGIKLVNESLTQVRLGKVRLVRGDLPTANTPSSPLGEETRYIQTDDEGNEIQKKPQKGGEGRNKVALRIMGKYAEWVKKELGGDSRVEYTAGGYVMLVKLLNKFAELEIIKILDWYIGSKKFKEHPQLTAAISADSIMRYFKDNE